ncbi:MAG: ATP-binding protein [Scytonema hyalinum WJT4-NPBG1]|jgi:SpoVK/Ycf46/Vps4 family AAA+-type ATPase|nr:ATP-binding protein [Scytonema hyalinum WJT4-NPBG1]
MARGEILRKLFKSFSQNNREEFYTAAMELIQEERDKNHVLLAKDLEKMLQAPPKKTASNSSPWNVYPDVPKDKDSGLPLIDVNQYELSWDRVVLPENNLKALEKIALENRKKDILYAHGLKPSSKLLFCGPPGCGKTLTAKVLSSVLGLPLVYVNLPSVISSYLGETAVNLKKIFDYIETGEWVILFDEFDAIAKDRNSFNEHGEIKRLVNSLIQLIDNSNNQSIFIAATNYESLLDAAIWRRFDEVLFFDKPDLQLRKTLLKNKLISIKHQGINMEKIASRLQDATGADIERICSDAIKSVILKSENLLTASDLEAALQRHLARTRIIEHSIKSIKKQAECQDDKPV